MESKKNWPPPFSQTRIIKFNLFIYKNLFIMVLIEESNIKNALW